MASIKNQSAMAMEKHFKVELIIKVLCPLEKTIDIQLGSIRYIPIIWKSFLINSTSLVVSEIRTFYINA